jgi:acetyltransferase-like isoleucine patch superfamily enzyme
MLFEFIRKIIALKNNLFNLFVLRRNGVKIGSGLRINGRIYIYNCGEIIIGNNVTINSGEAFSPVGGQSRTRLIAYRGARLEIGDNVGLSNSTIVSQCDVSIGDSTLIGGSCNIWDTDFHSLDSNIRGTSKDVGKSLPVHVGKNAFIGAHCIVLKGARIGDRSIVRAGSVIASTIKDDIVYKGHSQAEISR